MRLKSAHCAGGHDGSSTVVLRSDHIPSASRVFGSLVDIPINRYSSDTLLLMKLGVEKWQEEERSRGHVHPGTSQDHSDSEFADDADVYFIDVSLGAVVDADEQQHLMRIPTTLYLNGRTDRSPALCCHETDS